MHFQKSQLFFMLTLLILPFGEMRAENSLNISNVSANAGESGVHCFISATNDEPIEGFALGVQYPIPELVLTGADFTDTAVLDLLHLALDRGGRRWSSARPAALASHR